MLTENIDHFETGRYDDKEDAIGATTPYQWRAVAASNLALIKYMGKVAHEGLKNHPLNPSFSFSLNHLKTMVVIRQKLIREKDDWAPLDQGRFKQISLKSSAQKRFLDHWKYLKEHFNIEGSFTIESGNNFPADCGLASSASSFAALTQCAFLVGQSQNLYDKTNWSTSAADIYDEPEELFITKHPIDFSRLKELAGLSAKGSGSSARSFCPRWALWTGAGDLSSTDLPYKNLLHRVILLDDTAKDVSSSEAHLRVLSSPHYKDRPERASRRLQDLLEAFKSQNWSEAFQLCWDEFEDMHNLFETSQPSFSYYTDQTRSVLKLLKEEWARQKDGPLVTMDAGPNIHLLFRLDQMDVQEFWMQKISEKENVTFL